MANTLSQTITGSGINQGDLVAWMENVNAIVNELQADHATLVACVEAVLTKLDADGGITDTDYVAVHGGGGSGAALPATLTNSTALKLTLG